MDNLTPCPKCQSVQITIYFCVDGPHFARARCADTKCRYGWWLGKPDGKKIKRPASQHQLARKFGLKHCEWCGIAEKDLPNGETIEANHIIRYEEGGPHARTNIVAMCTACHKLWHWRQSWARVPQLTEEPT